MNALWTKLIPCAVIIFMFTIFCCAPVAGDLPPPPKFQITPDKAVYYPGDTILYHFQKNYDWFWMWGGPLVNITTADIRIDPFVTNITDNMPWYCPVEGNTIHCQVNSPSPGPARTEPLWTLDLKNFSNGSLWVTSNDSPVPELFTVSGVIPPNTPLGTRIGSSVQFSCENPYYPNGCFGSTDDVGVGIYLTFPAEFPTLILPAAMIAILIGMIFLIRRKKERT